MFIASFPRRLARVAPLIACGPLLLAVTGAASAGPKAYVGNFKVSTVSVIDTATDTVAQTVDDDVVVVDLATRAVVHRIALDKPPRDPEFSHDGRFLYVTTAGANVLRVIDTASNGVIAEIPTGASPHIGKWFVGTAVGTVVVPGPGELLTFDPASQKPLRAFAVGKQPHWMASDGKTVRVPNEGSVTVTP